MQFQNELKCDIHIDQKAIALCQEYNCAALSRKCPICYDSLSEFNCNLSHIISIDQLDVYLEKTKVQRLEKTNQLLDINNKEIRVIEGLIKLYKSRMSHIQANNEKLNKGIVEIKGVTKDTLFNEKLKANYNFIEFKKDINIQIQENILYNNLNQDTNQDYFEENFHKLIDCNEKKLWNIKSFKIQSIEIFQESQTFETILQSVDQIDEQINFYKHHQHIRTYSYPEFSKLYQEIDKEIAKNNQDKAFTLCIQMKNKYRDDHLYQSKTLEIILKTLNIEIDYVREYQHLLCQYYTYQEKMDRIISEYRKDFSLSLSYLQKINQNPKRSYSYGQYFTNIRIAQIYYKIRNLDQLQQQCYLISSKIQNDSFILYLLAKLAQIRNQNKISIIKLFESAIRKINAHPMFYRKYRKYLNMIGDYENSKRIAEQQKQRKFTIGNINDRDINCSNYLVIIN